jgi:N-acyl-D-amino-acid deacylase
MTGLTAETFGLKDRGVLREGAFADMVLFDPLAIGEGADFSNPIAPSTGIHSVFVNGQAVWRDGESTGARPGRVLRRHS